MNQCKHKLILFSTLLTLFIVSPSFAESIGGIASNITSPINEITDLLQTICLLTGIGLLIGATLKYRIHRKNPVQVPIGTPIIFVIIGLCLIAIYFLHIGVLQ